jgi:hypothetical protein
LTTLERVRPHLVVVNELYRQSGAESAAVSAKVSVVVRSCVCSRGSRVRWWVGIVVRFVIVCVRFVIRVPEFLHLRVFEITPRSNSHTHIHTMADAARARSRACPGTPRWLFTGPPVFFTGTGGVPAPPGVFLPVSSISYQRGVGWLPPCRRPRRFAAAGIRRGAAGSVRQPL